MLERAGDLAGAAEALTQSVERYRRLRAPLDAGYALVDLARVTLAQGHAAEAVGRAADAVIDFRHREDPRGRAAACTVLGWAYGRLGDAERARAVLGEADALAQRWGFALPESGQLDEAGEEPARGPGVQPLRDERPATVVRVRGQE